MHVDMRHMKPHDEQPHFQRLIEVCQTFPETMGELHERAIQLRCQAVKVRLVAFGNYQDMPRIQGPMVQKGQEVLVFIDGMAGDMPRHNRTKDTGVVPRLHQHLSQRLLSSRFVPPAAPPTVGGAADRRISGAANNERSSPPWSFPHRSGLSEPYVSGPDGYERSEEVSHAGGRSFYR
jgi:hypothetical protein